MKKIVCFMRLPKVLPGAIAERIALGIGTAVLAIATGSALAQAPTPAGMAPAPAATMSTPAGYSIHESVDLGGRITNTVGSSAMYDTMVNMQSGPRVQGDTFELRALPGTKGGLVDLLTAFTTGLGGDPYNFAKLNFGKGKLYDFSGTFRRDRQYFDYDLLGNPNIPSGQSITDPTTQVSVPWSQVTQSPFLFNTVRRMTDTNLTLLPLSKITFRAGYSQNIMQGPSLSPGGFNEATSPVVFIEDFLVTEYQRNSTDDFMGAIDWKPVKGTQLTYEEQVDHYKGDSYFTLSPNAYNVQEADGTKAVLLASYDTLTAPTTASLCNSAGMGGFAALSANPSGTLPIVNAACAVMTNYQRTQPIRILYPTEIFRLQSSSIKNISMNGDFRYTSANMNMPNYVENWQGLTAPGKTGAVRGFNYVGNASAKRKVVAADYGIVWRVAKAFSVDDQITFSNVHQPGTAAMTSATALLTPAVGTKETITYPGALTQVTFGTPPGSPAVGTPQQAYFGQRWLTNNLTGSWDATSRLTLSLTYRYSKHVIAENAFTGATDAGGNPGDIPIAVGGTNDGTVTINENGGIVAIAARPTANWNINGSVEILYNDNAFTPMTPRQTKQYRVHTTFRPKTWAVVSGSFNDLEHHNNGDNAQADIAASTSAAYAGPLDHVDYSRVVGLGAQLFPNDHYGVDFDYAYSDVYMADNICYLGGAATGLPAASTPSGTICPAKTAGRSGYDFGPALDFEHAPTQFGSVAFTVSPVKAIKSNIGYRINSVNGSRFYNDPRDVAGSLVSTYQSPFVNLAWTIHHGLVWKADYNFFGYGEGGPSGAALCSLTNPTPAAPATPVSCSSLPYQTGMNISSAGETAPRNFHANNITLGMHYEF